MADLKYVSNERLSRIERDLRGQAKDTHQIHTAKQSLREVTREQEVREL